MNKNILIFFMIAMIFAGCTDLLSPADDNHRGLSGLYADANFAEGVLMNGYMLLPINNYSFNDVATDDAVTNVKSNGYLAMATGQWTSQNNPTEQWTNSLKAINYLNLFLANSDKVNWSSDTIVSRMFNDRNKGEAYALRALHMYFILTAHGGYSQAGDLLGAPILTDVYQDADFKKPRNKFSDCVSQIYSDLNKAEALLPLDFKKYTSMSQVPSRYSNGSVEQYNRVYGKAFKQRITARIVKAIRAKVALLAASPAFGTGSWSDAADHAANVLDLIGGVSGLDPKGNIFYTKEQINAIDISGDNDNDQKEMLWRTSKSNSSSLEANVFPPSQYGSGQINPTQNLVDAFPMANGYPITDPASNYDPQHPYANRDPRLAAYIIYDGNSLRGTTIHTSVGSGNDAVDSIKTSTRTGYYIKKLIREDVNVNPSSTQSQYHYVPYIRYTEIYLDYAEAANEAWGPDGSGTHGYSARDVIAAIRKRAGISQPDNYLASITTKENMRILIHNERRLELCFEGFRFWDLRRWKEDITQTAKGVIIKGTTFTKKDVENRSFKDYMYYGPVPYTEMLKSDLIQNKGW
ncbi:MAG: RagB/SusD family nutrient uptake outer membrane protein [Bacteroidota bacterium]|nr:RagB/SusD family nutrient uptake outer membrane protein [Bacteroidota bacterium]